MAAIRSSSSALLSRSRQISPMPEMRRGTSPSPVRARRLAKATMRNIRQNLFFSFLFNGVGVPVAAGVLYPVAGILLSPMIAGAAMALSSFTVVTNALRLNATRL